DNGVTFKWKDYRLEGRERYAVMTLDTPEFIRRFLMHVLPQGFHRIRYYGLLTSPIRANNIARIREMLAVRSSRSTPSRPPTQRLRQAPSPKSQIRQSISALAAAAACASSRPSCRGNSPSTGRRRFRRRSGSTPHDNLTATNPKSRSSVRSLLSRPQRGALQACVHHTDLPPQHRPADQKDASHLSGNAIATAYSIAAPALAVARPPPNPHS